MNPNPDPAQLAAKVSEEKVVHAVDAETQAVNAEFVDPVELVKSQQ